MSITAVPFHLDQAIEPFEAPLAPARTIAPRLGGESTWERIATVGEAVARVVARDTAPIVISGDCVTSLAVVAGLQRAGVSPGVVWLDAHGDFNTERTSESGYLGGMPLAKICGLGELEIVERLGITPLDCSRILLVGTRDLDVAEEALIVREGVRRTTVAGLADAALPDGPLYLHLDVDVADPDDLPGLLFPAPGGPGRGELRAAIAAVVGSGRLAAIGVSLPWDWEADADPARVEYVRALLEPLRAWPGRSS